MYSSITVRCAAAARLRVNGLTRRHLQPSICAFGLLLVQAASGPPEA